MVMDIGCTQARNTSVLRLSERIEASTAVAVDFVNDIRAQDETA